MSYCEPIGHRQEDGDYQESWQPQAMTDLALSCSKEIAEKVTAALGGHGITCAYAAARICAEGVAGNDTTTALSPVRLLFPGAEAPERATGPRPDQPIS